MNQPDFQLKQQISAAYPSFTALRLKCAPFRVVRVGNQLRIVAASFWEWYSTVDDDETGGEGLHK
jgi:hypothetical protein